jgi:hypothetical protein
MKIVVDIWADEVLSKEGFWATVQDAVEALSCVKGDGWEIRDISLQTTRSYYTQTNRAYHINISTGEPT